MTASGFEVLIGYFDDGRVLERASVIDGVAAVEEGRAVRGHMYGLAVGVAAEHFAGDALRGTLRTVPEPLAGVFVVQAGSFAVAAGFLSEVLSEASGASEPEKDAPASSPEISVAGAVSAAEAAGSETASAGASTVPFRSVCTPSCDTSVVAAFFLFFCVIVKCGFLVS